MTTSVEENIFSGTKQSMTQLCIGTLGVQLIRCSLLPQQPQARLLQGNMLLEDVNPTEIPQCCPETSRGQQLPRAALGNKSVEALLDLKLSLCHYTETV